MTQLSSVCQSGLPPSGQAVPAPPRRRSKRLGVSTVGMAPPKKKAKSDCGLSSRVEQLSAELAEMKSLLQAYQLDAPPAGEGVFATPPMPVLTPEDDVLSLAASASHFQGEVGRSSRVSEASSPPSALSSASETGDSSMQTIMHMALERLKLEVPQQEGSGSGSAFFRRGPASVPFVVPPSEDYLRELHACWKEPSAFSRLSNDGRVLAAMRNAAGVGLDGMPAVEPAIASLIVSPEEALRQNVRCPRPQCRVTDDLLTRAYNAGARAGRLGNSLAHLLFALSASLQEEAGAASATGFSDAALQAFALMTRELGRVMSFLIQTRRQVWLAQSALTEACRRALRSIPVEPGVLFGSAALEALERTIQARQTRHQLSALSRTMPPPRRSRGPAAGHSARPQPRTLPQVANFPRPMQRRSGEEFRDAARQPDRQPRMSDMGRRPPRAPRGRGTRR